MSVSLIDRNSHVTSISNPTSSSSIISNNNGAFSNDSTYTHRITET